MVTLLGPHRCTCIVASYKSKTFAQQYNPQKFCQHTQPAHTHTHRLQKYISNVLFIRPLLNSVWEKANLQKTFQHPSITSENVPEIQVSLHSNFSHRACFFFNMTTLVSQSPPVMLLKPLSSPATVFKLFTFRTLFLHSWKQKPCCVGPSAQLLGPRVMFLFLS